MKSAICFVESPLQLLCLDEFVKFGNVERLKVIVRSNPSRPNNERQLRKLLGDKLVLSNVPELSCVFIYNRETVFSIIPDYHTYRCALAKESATIWDYAVIGDLRIPWMRRYSQSSQYNSLICLDDGMASFLIRDEIINSDNLNYRKKPDKKSIRATVRGMCIAIVEGACSLSYRKRIEIKDLILYSSFIDPSEVDVQVEKNDFSSIRKSNKKKSKVQEAWYYGSPLSERAIVSVYHELELLLAAKSFYKDRGLDTLYFAHRDDSEDKLKAIRELGLNIVKSEIPAELFIAQSEKIPIAIAASGSSVFFTLNKILDDIKYTNFCFDPEKIDLSHREHRARIDKSIKDKLDVAKVLPVQ
jgi:hypothetical protein